MNDLHIILAGWLIDGSGARPVQGQAVEVKDGVIRSIRKALPSDTARPDTIDLLDFTLLPCLVDSHVHLFMSGTDDADARRYQLHASFEEAKTVIRSNLRAQLACGVLGVRDGGDHGGYTLRYRGEGLDPGNMPLRLRLAGKAWHAPFRYGRVIGRTPIKGLTLGQSILKTQDRADHVKVVNSGLNSLSDFGKETLPQFGLDEMSEAVAVAHQLGIRMMVHANGRLPVSIAVEAGCDSIEHGFFMGSDNLRKMADKGIFWVPTIFTMAAYSQRLDQSSVEAGVARRNFDHQLEQIRTAEQCGVLLALGTDAGSLGVNHGTAVREEMKIWMSAGLSLEKTIQCATSRGATLLGLEEEMGTLIPGKSATFLAVRGGPEGLPDSLNFPGRIYMRGKEVSAEPCDLIEATSQL